MSRFPVSPIDCQLASDGLVFDILKSTSTITSLLIQNILLCATVADCSATIH